MISKGPQKRTVLVYRFYILILCTNPVRLARILHVSGAHAAPPRANLDTIPGREGREGSAERKSF